MSTDNILKIQDLQHESERRSLAKDMLLPACPNDRRATPNSFLRSALFSAVQGKDRANLKDEIVASQDGIVISYTGEQLNQEDLTLWETLVYLASASPLGDVCQFTAYAILKAMGLSTTVNGNGYKCLEKCIERLMACQVKIKAGGLTFGGPLINSRPRENAAKRYEIQLSRELIKLYDKSDWTAIAWDQRLELRRKPLAQALHGYYSTHKKPYPVKITTLHRLVGARNKHTAGFKRQAKHALGELVRIGFLESYSIAGDLVSVTKAVKRHTSKNTASFDINSPRNPIKIPYGEKLKHPNWQRKRLEVMSLANFACAECGDSEHILHVHHLIYRKGAEPWEYDNEDLRCLCKECHDAAHLIK
jgi:5-methylcytosine-specific restriction endonuclease McrA